MADQNMEKIAEERVVEEPFTMVKGKKSQKRKLDDSVSELLAMDTSEPEKKRPLLPPTSCEKIGVRLLFTDVQGFFNLYLMLMYDGLKDWCSSQYSKTIFLFVLGQIL